MILIRYLLGSRDAILELARSRGLLIVGALFVLSAGFAREYDGEDLVHEPWHALRPLGASFVTGTILFLLVHSVVLYNRKYEIGERPSFFRSWGVFLGLFWMTAPMAWLYAIPYERFMDPVDAVRVNLNTLAFVAAWRVILITRVVSVIYGVRFIPALFIVMLYADALAFFVITQVPLPVMNVMGGIRHSERDALLLNASTTVMSLSVLSAPIWLIGSLVAKAYFKPKWAAFNDEGMLRSPKGLIVSGVVSLIAFVPLLIMYQSEQVNRREAEMLLLDGKIREAFVIMSERSIDDYPPHWNPPPKFGYGEKIPHLGIVQDAVIAQRPAEWVLSIYLEKIERRLWKELGFHGESYDWPWIVERLGIEKAVLGTIRIDPEHIESAQFLLDYHTGLDDSDRDAISSIVEYSLEE